jgi:hypothetical protein
VSQYRTLVLVVALVVLSSAVSFAEEPITASNWQNHPSVAAIRAIVLEVDSLVKDGSLAHKKGEVEYDPGKDGAREAFINHDGVIRKSIREAGGEDSAAKGPSATGRPFNGKAAIYRGARKR